jgi:proteasome-associated ATPase
LGDPELAIRRIFRMAKKRARWETPVILFFDEGEALFRRRGSGKSSDAEVTLVDQFLTQLDGIEANANVITIVATNQHLALDPAVTRSGRVDLKVFIGRPSARQAREILRKYFRPWEGDPERTIPLAAAEVARYGSEAATVEALIDEAVALLYFDDRNCLRVTGRQGQEASYRLRDLVSGALLKAIIDRASLYAIKAAVEQPQGESGMTLPLLLQALRDEFIQNRDYLVRNLPTAFQDEEFEIELFIGGRGADL